MTEAPLYCPRCGEIVFVESDGEGMGGATNYYWCEECDEAVDPVREPPKVGKT